MKHLIRQRVFLFITSATLLAVPKLLFAQNTKADSVKRQQLVDSLHALKDNNPESFGQLNPGKGFLVASTKLGTINISGYMLARYINQMPATQIYYDHLGRQQVTDGRNDILWHRVQAFLTGWIYDPRLVYNITFWTETPPTRWLLPVLWHTVLSHGLIWVSVLTACPAHALWKGHIHIGWEQTG